MASFLLNVRIECLYLNWLLHELSCCCFEHCILDAWSWTTLWFLAKARVLVFLILLLCRLELCELSGKALFSFVTRSSRSSYVDEDCDSLALCDPMQRINYEVDSLPESCFDSGLSTLRDSNEYDSEVEYKHQRGLQKSHGTQESFGGDASDIDVSPRNHCLLGRTFDRNLSPCLTCICHGNTT